MVYPDRTRQAACPYWFNHLSIDTPDMLLTMTLSNDHLSRCADEYHNAARHDERCVMLREDLEAVDLPCIGGEDAKSMKTCRTGAARHVQSVRTGRCVIVIQQ